MAFPRESTRALCRQSTQAVHLSYHVLYSFIRLLAFFIFFLFVPNTGIICYGYECRLTKKYSPLTFCFEWGGGGGGSKSDKRGVGGKNHLFRFFKLAEKKKCLCSLVGVKNWNQASRPEFFAMINLLGFSFLTACVLHRYF